MLNITLCSLQSINEIKQMKELEEKIWGNLHSIPIHQIITAVKNGGLALGAFSGNKIIGFQYSFPGYDGENIYLCSHMLGVDQPFRNKGIGELLKNLQKKEALKMGYQLITWTYDPLETSNGYLNISKLGGICRSYIENCYGEMNDELNKGIPSDRFYVEWFITKNNNENPHEIPFDPSTAFNSSPIQWRVNNAGLLIPTLTNLHIENNAPLFVAVPKYFRLIREKNLTIANEWRIMTRHVFKQLFHNGWKVTGFYKNSNDEIPVHLYILRK